MESFVFLPAYTTLQNGALRLGKYFKFYKHAFMTQKCISVDVKCISVDEKCTLDENDN